MQDCAHLRYQKSQFTERGSRVVVGGGAERRGCWGIVQFGQSVGAARHECSGDSLPNNVNIFSANELCT